MNIDVKIIQKYRKKSLSQLKKIATTHFNKFIRNRDENKTCVSCGQYKALQAGHFYSGGHYPNLKFNPSNVHGQCIKCNMHLHGNLNEYRLNLIDIIGEVELKNLDNLAKIYKRSGYKWDKITLIEIIERYKTLNKLPF